MLQLEDLEGLYQLALRSPITAGDAEKVAELLAKTRRTLADGRQQQALEHARAVLASQVPESKAQEQEPGSPVSVAE